ncbi:MAG: lysozyme inhibitor LprI family protein [Phyllobacterium sp.]
MMKKTTVFMALSVAVLAASPAFPAQEESDTVSTELDACLATPQGQTTAGMVDCTHAAYLAYDRQLNEVYKRVLAAVDGKSAGAIRESQRKWVAWREAQKAADNGPWRADKGSLASLDIEAFSVDAIRARIRELQYYAP